MLDERPAVVRLSGRLAETFGLVPSRRLGCSLGQQFSYACRCFVDGVEDVAGALGRDVPNGQDARGRSGLAEALVVLTQVVDEIGGGPDVDVAVARPVCGPRVCK